MTSNSNFPFRSVRLGLAFIFILFMAVASWATDVTYTYTMSWKENVLRYTGTITSNTGEISNNFSSDNRVDNVLLKGNESASITEEYFSIKFACFRDVYKGSVNNTFRVTHSDAEFTITINNKNNNSYKIRKVTFKKSDGEEITSVTHVSTQSSASVALLPNTEFSTIVVELTDKPYYSVTPAEGLAISNTDGFVVDGTTYFHPATTITIAPTSAVQVITATNGTENTATIASDKRSFSFAMPSQAITPSATLEEAHVVALSGNVSISEPLFTYDGDSYYKSGDKITITATKTNEIIDGITGIADYAIAADKKSATFTMPTSDLTLAATTSEVHTVSVPTNLTISKEYITIGSIKYYKTGVTYTLAVANATHMIDEITGVTSSIAADKRSATFKMPSGNATIAATTYEVHSISVPNALSISSDPYATVGVSKYYKTGTKITLSLAADDLNRVIKTFNASGAVSPSIAEGLRSATLTVGAQDITVSATLLTIGGTCGSGTTWRMTDEDKNGTFETLNIGGTGALAEYANGKAPWYSDFRTTITRVNIGNDITTIPANPFYGIGDGAPIVLSTPALALKFKDAAFASKLRVPFGKYLFKATETADKKPAYDIATADDLRHLAAAVNANNSGSGKTFFQTANIDLASVGNFKPIGYADSTTFAGNYDGNRHVISGLKVSGSLNYAGLFGTVSGEIKNVILMNPSVSSSNNGADVGAIIGKLTGNASNCYFYGGNRSNAIGKMSKSAEVSNVSQAYTLKVAEHISGDKLADDPENGFQYDADNDGTPENYYRDGLELTLSHDETVVEPTETGYALTYLLDGQKSSNISGSTLTVGSATDGKTLSAAIRSDDQTHEITYIDANGIESTAQAIALDGTESTLKAGWYFVGRDIAYDHALSLSETVTFILGDGKTMNVDATSSEAIFAERNFTIYGQSGQSGILNASAKRQNSNGIINTSGDIVIRGGNVTATGESFGIKGHKNITISGGKVSATGGKYGIYSYGNITLSWTNSTDRITASSYKLGSDANHVIIPNGKYLKDEKGNVYSDKLDANQLSAIAGKTLTPAIPVKYIDENGEEQTIYNYTVLTKNTKVGSLAGGWFVVEGNVRYTNTVKFSEDAYLILTDGSKMEIVTEGMEENGIHASRNLTIYGQINQSGILADTAKGSSSYGIYSNQGNVTVNGGYVTATGKSGGISGSGNVTISGGTVTATGEIGGISGSGDVTISGGTVTAIGELSGIISNDVTISGGIVTATGGFYNGVNCSRDVKISGGIVTATGNFNGFYSENGTVSINGGTVSATGETGYGICAYNGDITISWTNSTDAVKASSYYLKNSENHVVISNGKAFKDEDGNVYSGTLTKEQLSAIKDKKLEPCYAVALDLQDGKDPVKLPAIFDENGVAHVVKPDDPTRSGFNFIGWFTAKDGDTEFDFSAAITGNTTAYAKWSVNYIDENGNEQIRNPGEYTVLTKNTNVGSLTGGWYVVEGEVRYTNKVKFSDDANLILVDGSKLTVDVAKGSAVFVSGSLSIYGQSGQSGILETTAGEDGSGIAIDGDIMISGVVVKATGAWGGINSNRVTINGGSVTATSEIGYGIYAYDGDITLSWTNSSDSIKASSYSLHNSETHVIIAEGKSLKDEDGNEYSGTLNDEQLSAIKGKTLTPASVQYIDENGNEKSIYNYTVLTADMAANELPGGWYVVENSDPNGVDVSLSSTLSFSGDVNLILADDAELNISGVNGANNIVIDGDAIDVAGKLTVYGQSNQTGSFFADAGKNGIYAKNGTVINGGSVNAYGTSGKGFDGAVDIHFKHYKNYIVASGFGGSVTVSGLALTESSKKGIYEGDLDENQVTVLNKIAENSLVLEPCYVVKFDKDNGSNPEFLPATFDKNGVAHVAEPADPTHEDGYSFLGWFNLDNTKFDFDAPVTANTEVFAHWEKDVLTVTFDTQDGHKTVVEAKYDENGMAYVAKPVVPTREGYTFLEWVYIPDGSASENPVYKRFDFTAPVTANMTVYAKWWENVPVEYSVAGQVNSIGQYTVLTSWTNVSESLPAGWYVVVNSNTDNDDDNGVDVRFTENLSFGSGVTRIILLDGAEMVVSDDVNSTIYADVLNVYGQTEGTGKLTVNSGNKGIEATNVNIYGGVVDAKGVMAGIYSSRTVSIYGGKVSVPKTSLYGIYVDMGDIALDWNNDGDRYTIGGYTLLNGSVIIAENKYFTDDGGNVYKGKLNDDQVAAIEGKTLKPANAVPYIDENGKEKFVTNYTVLTSDVAQTDENGVITLPAGWYVVQENVKFANRIAFAANDAGSKDVHLILADDAKMKVETEFSYAIGDSTLSTLTIYGQKNQSGVLEVSSEIRTGIYSYKGSIAIVGGHVNVSGENGIEANYVTIAGGNVEAKGDYYGISSVDGITLGWMNSTDAVKASSYDGTVTIAAGKAFKDEKGNEYRGTLEAEQIEAIKGKKLIPLGPKSLTSEDIVITDIPVQNYDKDNPVCPDTVIVTDGDYVLKYDKDYIFECFNNTAVSSATLGSSAPYVKITGMGNYVGEIEKRFYIWKNIGNYAAVQVYKDNDGVTHAEIDGDYTGKDAVNIPNDIEVDMVKFNRKFTVTKNGGFSTLMLPFSVKSVYVKGVEGIYKFAYVADCSVKKDGKNDVCVNKVWENTDSVYVTLEANTPYMVKMKESTLRINTKVTLAKTSGGTLYDSRVDAEEEGKATWQMRGVFGYKEWACNDADLGKVWGYAGEPRKDVYIGKYVQFGPEVWINPFRAYLYDPNGEKMQCTAKPKAVAYAKAYTAEFMPAQSKAAANATNAAASSEVASIDEFGGMQVVIVEDGSEKSIAGGKEHTTTVGRKNPAVTEIRVKPRTSQTYDLKGRRVGNGKKAKGAYYRR